MMRFRAFQSIAMVTALLAVGTPRLWASDGQVDVLLNSGSTNSISAAGSYVLVNSVVGTVSPILTISASDVTLDLNGQTIEGGAGLVGIRLGAAVTRVRIKNGKIKNCVTGIDGTTNSSTGTVVEDVQVLSFTAGTGIALFTEANVRNCTATGGGTGIQVGANSIVSGCNASNNTTSASNAFGIRLGANCQAIGNTANGNVGAGASGNGVGIETGTNCYVRQNECNGNLDSGTATSGTGAGIATDSGSTIIENVCNLNGRNLTGASGSARGIGGPILGGNLDNCIIRGNTCIGNIGQAVGQTCYGIAVSNGCRVESNTLINNTCASGTGYGIYVDITDNFLLLNFTRGTTGTTTAGIRLNSGSGGNRYEQNHTTEATGISDAGTNSGAPDAAGNVAF